MFNIKGNWREMNSAMSANKISDSDDLQIKVWIILFLKF